MCLYRHPPGLLVPKVEVEEQPATPPPHSYGTPPSGDYGGASSSADPANHARQGTTKENNDSYQCSICYESFPTAKTYKNHMANHKIPMTTYSNESSSNPSTPADVHLLREHILAHVRDHQHQFQLSTGGGPPGPSGGDSNLIEKCQYCYKLFADRVQLQIHLKEHNSLKEYKCLNCNKMYASLNYLKLHYKMHADLKPYKCQYCDKRFTFSSNLYVHHRIHTGHKPYRCEKCSKCFSQINSLKQHHRIHRDQLPPTTPLANPIQSIPGPSPLLLNNPGISGTNGPTLIPNSLLPSLIPGNHGQQLPPQGHMQTTPMPHQKTPKGSKNEFSDVGEEAPQSTDDKVLNMSNRQANSGDVSIQEVIIQQLQQRLVSQP